MRAALLEWWPVLTSEFGLYPWHTERLSEAEIQQYQNWILDKADQQSRG